MEHDYYMDGYNVFGMQQSQKSHYVNERDQRSKSQYPYSYSEFYLLGNRDTVKNCSADYSDRLQQWDYEKYRAACTEMGCRFDQASWDKLNKFLETYYGPGYEATGLAEGCNASNGYPYWIIWYKKI
jgi:hypothetical protein